MRTKYPHRVEPGYSLKGFNFMTGHNWLIKAMGDKDKGNNVIEGEHNMTNGENNPEKEKGNKYT